MFPPGEDEIGSAVNDDDVEQIDTSSRKKGPAKKRTKKSQLKDARTRNDNIARGAVERFKDIHRMTGQAWDKRTEDIVTFGKENFFNEAVLEDRTCPYVEITADDVKLASKVPILTREQIIFNYEGGQNIRHEQTNKDIIFEYTKLRDWVVKECKEEMKHLIIVADGLVWFDRYDNDGQEVPNYQYIFANVGIYVWIKNAASYKLVRVEPLFDQLLKKHRQAVMSYVCCMAHLDMEEQNEDRARDDPDYKVLNL